MDFNVGRQLGVMLAQIEDDLREDPDNMEALQRMALLSESYRNFATAGKADFTNQFEAGYRACAAEILQMREREANFKPPDWMKEGDPGLG